MRVWVAAALGFATSACEFVQVQPVPVAMPIPLPATARGSSSGASAPPQTPAEIQAAMAVMSNVELCGLINHPVYGSDALSEITQHSDFSDDELALIQRREVGDGMREDAVQCACGIPSQIQDRSHEEYDLVYRYRNTNPGSASNGMIVYFREGEVVDFQQVSPEPPSSLGTTTGVLRQTVGSLRPEGACSPRFSTIAR